MGASSSSNRFQWQENILRLLMEHPEARIVAFTNERQESKSAVLEFIKRQNHGRTKLKGRDDE